MKRIIKIIIIVLFAVFIAAQFVRPNFTNPPVDENETLQSSLKIPENVRAILKRSCNDCHSNETVYPWYSKIQPSAWFLAGHIEQARNELNFSIWNTYENRRKTRKLEEICEQVESRAMPLPSYLWIHQNARLTDEEVKILCDWTKTAAEELQEN